MATRTLGATPGAGLQVGAEAALVALSLAGVASLARLFSEAAWAGPVVVAAVASHALAVACRRRALSLLPTFALSLVGLWLFAGWAFAPSTTAYGLPGRETWSTLAHDLAVAWDRFAEVRPPVAAERGFVVAAAVAAWGTALVADWAAFRVGTALEAVIPSFTMFTFSAALRPGGRSATTALYLAAVTGFVLVHGVARRTEGRHWFASRLGRGPGAIVRSGAGAGAAAVAAALVIGPLVPGAGDPPVLDWRGRAERDPTRVTISPLVDIRGRLVDQADVEVFTVRADRRAYWRLTALDTFDGQVWGARGSYGRAHGRLPGAGEPGGGRLAEGEQEFRIGALSSIWLPAAWRPARYDGPDGVRFDPESATLITERDSAAGLVYRVRSVSASLTAEELRGAPGETPEEVRRRYTALPADFPRGVAELAARVTAGEPTTYGRARALQDWFRRNFTYSLDVPPGHGEDAIVRFLRSRTGYCEQFAGTYAAMARSLGIPARVAVGFTPGELGPDGRYHVTGRQAHAWPEVFIAGFGWVAFEPTPGRGAPGAETYTGVPEQQETSRGAVVTPTTAPGPASGTPTTAAPAPRPGLADELRTSSPAGAPERPAAWAGRLVVAGVVLGALLAAWIGGVPAARALRRHRRWSRASTPEAVTLVAWEDATEALALAGLPRRPAETPAEYARRVAAADGLPAEVLPLLAGAVSEALFAPGPLPAVRAEEAVVAAAAVRSHVRATVPWRRRAAAAVDPRRRSGAA
jgi:transglutaminase-like putative cysteine protease